MAAIRKDAGRQGRAVVAAEADDHHPDPRDLQERLEVKRLRDRGNNHSVARRDNLSCMVLVRRVHNVAVGASRGAVNREPGSQHGSEVLCQQLSVNFSNGEWPTKDRAIPPYDQTNHNDIISSHYNTLNVNKINPANEVDGSVAANWDL
jgi:hypothetical protein